MSQPQVALFKGRPAAKIKHDDSDDDTLKKSAPVRAPPVDLSAYATIKQMDDVKAKLNSEIDQLNKTVAKLQLQLEAANDKETSDVEILKKGLVAIETDVTSKQTQMFMEMEGFIKARKRDKNDQNALIRSLS